MAYADLREFIQALEKHSELRRISFEVDPVLEIAEFADRAVKQGGPALLFEKPKDSQVPVFINGFASMRKMEIALEVASVEQVAQRISEYLEMRMPEGLIGKLKMLPKLAEMGSFFPRTVSKGPCKEVIRHDGFSGRRTPGVLSPYLSFSRRTLKPASATAECTGCRSTMSGLPECTGRHTSMAPSITAAG
jgi:4-hydroxy-3-polyprenylbenzoate decarboxylase